MRAPSTPIQASAAERIGQKLEQQVVPIVRNPHAPPLADLIIREWQPIVQTLLYASHLDRSGDEPVRVVARKTNLKYRPESTLGQPQTPQTLRQYAS